MSLGFAEGEKHEGRTRRNVAAQSLDWRIRFADWILQSSIFLVVEVYTPSAKV
jgi:hypothetical protein